MAGRYKRGWSAVHQQVFKLRMIDGLTPKDIAVKTGIPISRIRDMVRTNQFIEHEEKTIAGAVEKARKLLEGKLILAANKIVSIMQYGKSEDRLKFDAAKEILYQCGMKPVEVVETRTRQYTPEEIQSSLTVIKEVQAIEEKLSTQGSGFLVSREQDKQDVDASPTVSSVTNNALPSQGAEVPADVKEEVPSGVE